MNGRAPSNVMIIAVLVLAGAGAFRCACEAAAQETPTFTLTGYIVDVLNDAPIGAAVIKVPQLRRFVFSDVKGRFRFPDFPVGTWEIVVEQLGYHTLDGSVTVAEGNGLYLRLKPDPIALEGLRVRTRSGRLLERRRKRYPFRITTVSSETIAATIQHDPAAIFRRHANSPIVTCPSRLDPWMSWGGCMYKRGRVVKINVYLDESYLMGGMNELALHDREEIHSMDWIPNTWGDRGPELRVYTRYFLERVNNSGIHLAAFRW